MTFSLKVVGFLRSGGRPKTVSKFRAMIAVLSSRGSIAGIVSSGSSVDQAAGDPAHGSASGRLSSSCTTITRNAARFVALQVVSNRDPDLRQCVGAERV